MATIIPRAMRDAYRAHLQSARWQELRSKALTAARGRCQRCGSFHGRRLQVHHRTYERFGNELPQDLVALCHPCHEIEDTIRANHTRLTRYRNGLNTYMTKKYGPLWKLDRRSHTEFDDWLTRKRRERRLAVLNA